MASVSKDGKGWRILFTGPDGTRRTLRLGPVDKKTAESIRCHVEALLTARTAGVPMRQETATWLASVGDKLRDRLARCGLVDAGPTGGRTLAELIPVYLERQTHTKPTSQCATRHAMRNLMEFFGGTRRIDAITPGDADDFVKWLTSAARARRRNGAGDGLRGATALKRIERVRAFFRDAMRRRLIDSNPFVGVKRPKIRDADRQVYIPVEIVERLIAATPDPEWRLILALSRYLGVRVPSEPFSMTWADVDWAGNRLRIPSPKTEVHDKPFRIVPIVPEVRPHLEAVFEAAQPGQTYIFRGLRQRESAKQAERGWWAAINLRQHLLRLIARIGETPWPRLWHSLRASAQTDLTARFPMHVVTAWLGNTPQIATRHYLRVTPDDFARASSEGWKSVPREHPDSGAKSDARGGAKTDAAHSSTQW